MAYLLPKSLILHIPKTGSDWVRKACQASVQGRKITEIRPWHCDLQTAKQILSEIEEPLPFIGTFVRNPLDWYKSAWTYWMETGRFPRGLETPAVESHNFERFVRNCLEIEPNGYVTTLYERFTGLLPGEVSFIGQQERLADDLVRLLKLAGEEFDEQKLRETPPRNVRGSNHENGFPGYSYELAREVIGHEKRAMHRFGYLF